MMITRKKKKAYNYFPSFSDFHLIEVWIQFLYLELVTLHSSPCYLVIQDWILLYPIKTKDNSIQKIACMITAPLLSIYSQYQTKSESILGWDSQRVRIILKGAEKCYKKTQSCTTSPSFMF